MSGRPVGSPSQTTCGSMPWAVAQKLGCRHVYKLLPGRSWRLGWARGGEAGEGSTSFPSLWGRLPPAHICALMNPKRGPQEAALRASLGAGHLSLFPLHRALEGQLQQALVCPLTTAAWLEFHALIVASLVGFQLGVLQVRPLGGSLTSWSTEGRVQAPHSSGRS